MPRTLSSRDPATATLQLLATGLGGLLLGGGIVLTGVGAVLCWADRNSSSSMPTTILQDPSAASGRWEKAAVFVRERRDVYREAIFDRGMDFVNSSTTLTEEQAKEGANKLRGMGYVERDVAAWGSHYGI